MGDEIHEIGSRGPPVTASLPARRAFLVMVSDEIGPASDELSGRVEHLDSGRRARFSSHEELGAFFAEILRDEPVVADSESSPAGMSYDQRK